MNPTARALRALEKRVRLKIAASMDALATTLAAFVTSTVAASGITNATELLSDPSVYSFIKAALDATRAAIWATILAAYTAAIALGRLFAATLLRPLGHTVPTDLTISDDTENRLRNDVEIMFGNALLDIPDAVRTAYDGVTGDNPTPARTLTTRQAAIGEVNRIRNRAVTAGATAVHRGARDAELAAFDNYRRTNPYITLRKQWTVTATNPCGMCAALHGTTIAVDAEFDHQANDDPGQRLVPVWGDLQGPPRHPNCRCQLILVTESAPPR